MSNETDLDWLARNVHVWSDGMREALVCYPRNVETLIWSCVSSDAGWITKGQWLARRSELQNKPSWKDAPEWAQWLGQDEDGVWYWHGEEPNSKGEDVNGCCYWMSHGLSDIARRGVDLGDWRDTLERRPVDLSEPAVTARLTEATKNVLAAAPALMDEKFSFDRGDWFERGELPPVGVWCEAYCDGAEPEKCKILAYHKQQVAVRWSQFNQGCLDVLDMPDWSFRPIRTEREMAIDEMMGSVLAVMNQGLQRRLCEDLYDAGYRKESK